MSSVFQLGPLVIHKDGTASRIEGWASKSKEEQSRVLRVLGKRHATPFLGSQDSSLSCFLTIGIERGPKKSRPKVERSSQQITMAGQQIPIEKRPRV